MHLYITRGCRGTLPKFLRSKGRRLRRLKASFVRSSQILESGKWKLVGLQQNEVLMNNRHFFNTNYEHVSVLIKSVWCFFSSSNYWNRAHPEAPFSVRFQSHNIPFKRTSSCLSILIWTQFLTQIWGQRADGWSKKGIAALWVLPWSFGM